MGEIYTERVFKKAEPDDSHKSAEAVLQHHRVKEYRDVNLTEGKDEVIPIDVDGNGVKEYLYFNSKGNDLRLVFDETGVTNYQNGIFRSAYPTVPIAYGETSRVTVADLDGDKREDIILTRNFGIEVYLSKIGVGKEFYLESLMKGAYKLVPEYQRAGPIEVGLGAFNNYEEISTSTVTQGRLQKYLGTIPQKLRERLPKEFYLGTYRMDVFTGGAREGFKNTVGRLGSLHSNTRSSDESWIQDNGELAVEDNGNEVMLFSDELGEFHSSGGNIFFTRNSAGWTVVVVSEAELGRISDNALESARIVLSQNGARRFIAKQLNLEASQVIVLPKVANYVHLDQQIFFPSDGNVIMLKLPEGHPDAKRWNDAKKDLEEAGFKVTAEISVPEYFLKSIRSPFNILTFKDEATGRPKYVIPVDPLFIAVPGTSRFIDVMSGELVYSKSVKREFKENDPRAIGGRREKVFIYDKENPWSHVEQIRQALKGLGIPEEDIILFNHNGYGQGSLHCVTRVHNLEEK